MLYLVGEKVRHSSNSNLSANIQKVNSSEKEGIILAISDLHYTKDLDEENEAYLLIEDLKTVYFDNPQSKMKLEDVDYMVVSGDFVDSRYDQSAMINLTLKINILILKVWLRILENCQKGIL